MRSIDTNILVYAQNIDCAEHKDAFRFILECGQQKDIVICELVLVELYILLRNPAVLSKPLSAQSAASVCLQYRRNPYWRLVENAPVMANVWEFVSNNKLGRRHIFDSRLALTLRHHGVSEFATANTKDFQYFGFNRVWNPITKTKEA